MSLHLSSHAEEKRDRGEAGGGKMWWRRRRRRREVQPTGFEDVLIDFDLASDWLPVLQVGEVGQRLRTGGGAGGGAGVTVGDAVTWAVSPATCSFFQHCHQLLGGGREFYLAFMIFLFILAV